MRRRHRRGDVELDPRDGGPGRQSHRKPTGANAACRHLGELLETLDRHRRTGGQRPFGGELEQGHDPLKLAGAIGLRCELRQPLSGIRIATPNSQLAENRLGEQPDDDAALDLAPRQAFGLLPLAGPEAQPGDHRGRVGRDDQHLVLLGVGDRLARVPKRLLRLHPPQQADAEVLERT